MQLGEFLATALGSSQFLMQMTLGDMSDAELMTRPTPAANHGNWQLGHLVVAETNLMSACGAKMPELPAGFAERYTKETSKSDDASKFAKKDELIALLTRTRAATIAFAKGCSAEQLGAPGPEKYRSFAPTVAAMVDAQSGHLQMHMGQIQVLRRKLGKPVLF